MKYIITGGLGFIGSHLYEKLIHENKYNILLIDNQLSGTTDNIKNLKKTDFVNMDIRDKNIEKYFEENDIVIHLAAISSLPTCQSNPVMAYDVNVSGTINVLEICRKKNIKKVLFASTSAIYENNENFPAKETDNVDPTLIYSLSKYTCEKICNSYIFNYNMDISIIRFFNVYGGNQDFRRTSPPLTVYIMLNLLKNQSPILHSNGEQKRDYIYIDDLLDLIINVINLNTKGQIFNACSNNLISVNEIFELIQKEMKVDIKPTYTSAFNYWNKYTDIVKGNNPIKKEIIHREVNKFTLGDNSNAKRILNWSPKYNMKTGISKMVKVFLDHSYLN